MSVIHVNEQFLKNGEGLRQHEYLCTAGKRTIGYGHKLAPNEHYPDGITQEQAEKLFQRDVGIAVAHIDHLLNHPVLTSNQLTALVSMVFNCGSAPLLGTPGHLLLSKKYVEAAKSFVLYHHSHGKGEPCNDGCDGLYKRRIKERDLFLKP